MKRDIHSLAKKEYDLVVIGGGIFGACAAWDAVQRGLKVALVEKYDFCHATSAQHFKMIHGGMRYLQHLDFRRVRESSRERSTFLRIAPHLAVPMPIMMPTYGHGIKGKEVLKAGLLLYDILTMNKNRKIKDPNRKIPNAKTISKKEVLKHFPGVNRKNLSGGVIFYDGHFYNPTRLVISIIRSAVNAGLDAANYLEITHYLKQNSRVLGVRVKDFESGKELEVKGKIVLNAAGPWAQQLNQRCLKIDQTYAPTFSRDLLIVVSRPLTKHFAFGNLSQSHDSDALLDRGGRHIFVIPWRDYSLIGVWHKVHTDSLDEIKVTADELQAYIEEINSICGDFKVTMDDISMVNTGLILFGEVDAQGGAEDHSFGKESKLIDHSTQDSIDGLVSLIGVRATVARKDAEKAIDMVFEKLGKKRTKSKTDTAPVHGGEIENFEELVKKVHAEFADRLNTKTVRALIHNYGSEYPKVVSYAKENPDWLETVNNSTVLKAEIIHAVREEMAQKLGDVVFRRTELGTAGNPGEIALNECADLMGEELSWDDEKKSFELNQVRNVFVRPGAEVNYTPVRDAMVFEAETV